MTLRQQISIQKSLKLLLNLKKQGFMLNSYFSKTKLLKQDIKNLNKKLKNKL